MPRRGLIGQLNPPLKLFVECSATEVKILGRFCLPRSSYITNQETSTECARRVSNGTVSEKARSPTPAWKSFFARPVQAEPEVEQDVVAEQELSGICSRDCMKYSNAGSDAVLGKAADQLTAEEVATMNNNPQSTYTVRKPTEAERALGAELTFMRRLPPESPPGSPLPELG